jgi:PAS domain S-box-containing protein
VSYPLDAVRASTRLEALRRVNLLRPLLGPTLDRLTRLATRTLDVPVAQVVLVDAEQEHVISCFEDGRYMPPYAMPLETSFCKHVVASNAPLVVSDWRAHPLLRNTPLLRDESVVAYLGVPLTTADGHALGTVCAIVPEARSWSDEDVAALRDLAALAMAEIALHERTQSSEARNQALLDAMPDVIVCMHRDGTYLDVKASHFARATKFVDSLRGRRVQEVFPPEVAEERMACIWRALTTGELQIQEYQTEIEGEIRSHEARIIAYAQDEVLVMVRNIGERKQAEQALILAREAALEASRLKSAFLANISHEIRTPMNGVVGMLDVLLESPLDSQQQEAARIAHGSALALLTLLDDVLDLSKIEAGKLTLNPRPFDLRALVDEVVALFGEMAQRNGLLLAVELPTQIPQLVGDPLRLRQVLTNLVNNAVKFTSQGRVDLEVAIEPLETDAVSLRCSVQDTGIGISPTDQLRLFRPFTQLDDSSTRRYGGSGLGLVICREIVELMGGWIDLQSTPGVGTRISFGVPLRRLHEQPPHEAQPAPLARPRGRILVAEDNRINQKVILAQLRQLGFEADVVDNGQEAVRAVLAGSYELVLMDVQMPGMDGLSATQAIRQGQPEEHIPIIALTAHTLPEERKRCLDAGMDDHLSKPITRELLTRAINRWLAPDAP